MRSDQLGTWINAGSTALIRAESTTKYMSAIESAASPAEIPLPESHHDLEMLLQALHALNDALDQYQATEAPDPSPAAWQ